MTVEAIVGMVGALLLSVVGYFLRKTHDKIDLTSAAIEKIGTDFDVRIDRLETKLEIETKTVRNEIVDIFQGICHERQLACGKLRDAKLDAVEKRADIQCKKIEVMVNDRERRWERQEALNEKIRSHIYKTKDGGSSWDLKDRG